MAKLSRSDVKAAFSAALDEIEASLDEETRESWSWMSKLPGRNIDDAVWYYIPDRLIEVVARKLGVPLDEFYEYCSRNVIPTNWSEYTAP